MTATSSLTTQKSLTIYQKVMNNSTVYLHACTYLAVWYYFDKLFPDGGDDESDSGDSVDSGDDSDSELDDAAALAEANKDAEEYINNLSNDKKKQVRHHPVLIINCVYIYRAP